MPNDNPLPPELWSGQIQVLSRTVTLYGPDMVTVLNTRNNTTSIIPVDVFLSLFDRLDGAQPISEQPDLSRGQAQRDLDQVVLDDLTHATESYLDNSRRAMLERRPPSYSSPFPLRQGIDYQSSARRTFLVADLETGAAVQPVVEPQTLEGLLHFAQDLEKEQHDQLPTQWDHLSKDEE